MPLCSHIKDDGDRCGQVVGEDTDLCIWHDPERKKEAAKARKKAGGHNRKTPKTADVEDCPPAPENMDDVATWLSWLTFAVTTGEVDARTAKEAGGILRILKEVLEKTDQADRIRELQKKLEDLQNGRRLESVS